MKPLFTDRTAGGFLEEVHKQRTELRKTAEYVVSDGGLIDQYYEETKLSAENDHVINPDEEDTSPEYSYQEKTETLKTWLKNRLAWLDANINSIDDMVHTITYVIDGEIAAKDYCQKDGTVMVLPLEPRKEGYAFMGWKMMRAIRWNSIS